MGVKSRLTQVERKEQQTRRRRVLDKVEKMLASGQVTYADIAARWPNVARDFFGKYAE